MPDGRSNRRSPETPRYCPRCATSLAGALNRCSKCGLDVAMPRRRAWMQQVEQRTDRLLAFLFILPLLAFAPVVLIALVPAARIISGATAIWLAGTVTVVGGLVLSAIIARQLALKRRMTEGVAGSQFEYMLGKTLMLLGVVLVMGFIFAGVLGSLYGS